MARRRDGGSVSYAARVRGCLLGGALGDALGAPVEFLSLAQIRNVFGVDGIAELAPAYGRVGAITDDTQMTLFTAEGLIRAAQRARDRGICDPNVVMRHAYWRWLTTQGYAWDRIAFVGLEAGGWLIEERILHSPRAPGNTCVSALRAVPDDLRARNDSKGCGGVMRSAPVGLARDVDAFEDGCSFAAITHGHPTGQLASGAFALIVRRLVEGADLETAARDALARLAEEDEDRADETIRAIEAALDAAADTSARPPSAEVVESLGRGWIAEEALAIGLYCALVAEDFVHGIRLAVNHGGDSDSTGSIAGNLLGAWWGEDALPGEWLEELEARAIIERLARDFATCFKGDDVLLDFEAYPSWYGAGLMPRGMPPGAWFTTLERNGETVYVGHSLPIRMRYESDWGDPFRSEAPFVRYFYRDRWLATWAIDAKSLLDGSLDRALKDPVRLNIYLRRPPGECLEGGMYAESLYSSEPAIDLGPLKLDAPRVYGPDDRGRAAIDAVLHCLYAEPSVAAERLITDMTSKGIFG